MTFPDDVREALERQGVWSDLVEDVAVAYSLRQGIDSDKAIRLAELAVDTVLSHLEQDGMRHSSSCRHGGGDREGCYAVYRIRKP